MPTMPNTLILRRLYKLNKIHVNNFKYLHQKYHVTKVYSIGNGCFLFGNHCLYKTKTHGDIGWNFLLDNKFTLKCYNISDNETTMYFQINDQEIKINLNERQKFISFDSS